MKNVGDNAFSGRPKFSAASLFNTQHNTLSSAYTSTFNRPLTLFTVNPNARATVKRFKHLRHDALRKGLE